MKMNYRLDTERKLLIIETPNWTWIAPYRALPIEPLMTDSCEERMIDSVLRDVSREPS